MVESLHNLPVTVLVTGLATLDRPSPGLVAQPARPAPLAWPWASWPAAEKFDTF